MTELSPEIRMGVARVGVDDMYEVPLSDGTIHAVVRISGRAMEQCRRTSSMSVFSMVAYAVGGAVLGLQAMQRNRPEIGLMARLRDSGDRHRPICWINRHLDTIRFDDGVERKWSDCEYG